MILTKKRKGVTYNTYDKYCLTFYPDKRLRWGYWWGTIDSPKILLTDCINTGITDRDLWKNDKRQVYTKSKNYLWWLGSDSNNN